MRREERGESRKERGDRREETGDMSRVQNVYGKATGNIRESYTGGIREVCGRIREVYGRFTGSIREVYGEAGVPVE